VKPSRCSKFVPVSQYVHVHSNRILSLIFNHYLHFKLQWIDCCSYFESTYLLMWKLNDKKLKFLGFICWEDVNNIYTHSFQALQSKLKVFMINYVRNCPYLSSFNADLCLFVFISTNHIAFLIKCNF